MKRIIPFLLALFLLTGCGGTAAGDAYQQITQEEAKEMMDTQEVIILDVREQDEYDSGHIPGAVLLPVGSIDETTAAAETAVRPPLPRWPSWATPTSTNSAASTPGPMKQSRKTGRERKRHKICAA